MIHAIALAAFMLTPPGDAPKVQIKRIVRLAEKGFARDPGASGEQADYDALVAHLLGSKETAAGWSLGGNEVTQAELAILTKEGEILRVEVIGTLGASPSPTAILLHGKGRGARINVKGFKHPERRK
jgi:hypothetical protein